MSVLLLPAKDFPKMEALFSIQDIIGADILENNELTAEELFSLSLRFSECDENSPVGLRCRQKFQKIKKEVTSREYKSMGVEERGRAILKLLYRDYLKTYDFNQTRIDVALESGVYNCVSSALLYMAAAKSASLNVRGQKTTEHAFCTVYEDAPEAGKAVKKFDVETTNPYGFNPGSKEAIDNEANIKRYYIVPKKYYANREEVNDVIFAGLIAGNICSYYLKENDFEKALPLGATRYETALTVTPAYSKALKGIRRDFDVIASNYVNLMKPAALEGAQNIEWYTSFIDRWSMTDYLQKNIDNLFNNFLAACYTEKQYSLASAEFEKNKKYLSQKIITKSEIALIDIYITTNIDPLPSEKQIEKIEALVGSDKFSTQEQQKRILSYLENAWLINLGTYMTSGDFESGYHKAKDVLEKLPQSQKIKRLEKAFYDNCIAIIHNNFVVPANSGRYEEARQILEEGLQKYPDDKTLKSDLTALEKLTTD